MSDGPFWPVEANMFWKLLTKNIFYVTFGGPYLGGLNERVDFMSLTLKCDVFLENS